jgi:hypothetical protein
LATPSGPVVTVVVLVLFEKVPLAPLEGGAVKVTEAPLTGLLLRSITVAAREFVNVVLTVVFWGVVPEFANIWVIVETVAQH